MSFKLHMLSCTHVQPQGTGEGGRGRGSADAPSFPVPGPRCLSHKPALSGGRWSSPPMSHHDSVSCPGALTPRLHRLDADTVNRLEVSRRKWQSQPKALTPAVPPAAHHCPILPWDENPQEGKGWGWKGRITFQGGKKLGAHGISLSSGTSLRARLGVPSDCGFP